jgi:DNA repair exonuclease SbcCD ATPase subunit
MTDIFDSIKQGAGQVLSNIDQKGQLKSALDGIRSQWNELERRRKTSALDKEIKTQQAEMRQLTEALGLQTWSLFDAGKIVHPELSRLCERISELRAEIDAKKAELETLKAQQAAEQQAAAQQAAAQQAAAQQAVSQGATAQAPVASAAGQIRTAIRLRCPRCKTELSAGDDFCPTCGVKIVHPAAQPAAAQPAAAQARTVAQTQPSSPMPAQPPVAQQTTASGIRFCPSCGAETKPNAQFCPICGQALH